MNNEKILITPAETQKLLGIGRSTLYNLLKEDDFPSTKIGSKYMVNRLRLQDWADKMVK